MVEDLVKALNALQKEAVAYAFSDVIHPQMSGDQPLLVKTIEDAICESGDNMDFDLEVYSQFYVDL